MTQLTAARPPDNHVSLTLWYGSIVPETIERPESSLILSPSEQTRAASIKNTTQRERFIVVRKALRNKISQYLDLSPNQLLIDQTAFGRPFLVDRPDVDFNLSHTADRLVIVAGRNCRIGVDMETYRFRSSLNDLVDKCFAENEAAWWRAQPEDARVRNFYRFWTRKEAFVKATGFGISLGLNRCIVNTEKPESWLAVPENCGPASDWHSYEFEPDEHGCVAVVTDRPISAIQRMAL